MGPRQRGYIGICLDGEHTSDITVFHSCIPTAVRSPASVARLRLSWVWIVEAIAYERHGLELGAFFALHVCIPHFRAQHRYFVRLNLLFAVSISVGDEGSERAVGAEWSVDEAQTVEGRKFRACGRAALGRLSTEVGAKSEVVGVGVGGARGVGEEGYGAGLPSIS